MQVIPVPRFLARRFDLLTALGVIAPVSLFETVSRTGLVSASYLPPPTSIAQALFLEVTRGSMTAAALATLQGWAMGLALALAIALPTGLLLGLSPTARHATRSIVEFLRPVPSVALIPVAILVLGTGLRSKVCLVAYAAFWVLLIQVIYGIDDADELAIETARIFRVSPRRIFVHVLIPSAMPYIITGVRIASAVALILAITAELVIGTSGLGRELSIARSSGAVAVMYSYIVVTGLLGWLLNALVSKAERSVLHWHPSVRGGFS